MKGTLDFKLVREVINAIRECIFNSTISLQKYKKFLHSLNEKLITFSKDIEIRFNSILPLLDQILSDYVLVLKFMELQCSRSQKCRKYLEDYRVYQVRLRAYAEAVERQRAALPPPPPMANTNSQHAAQLLGAGTSSNRPKLVKPKEPTMPRVMDIRNALSDPRFLLVMALHIDYIRLFDDHATKTGSVQWINCLTENELRTIKVTLVKWQNQNERHPKSPTFSRVCSNIEMNRGDGIWTYTGPGGQFNFSVELTETRNKVRECNEIMNKTLTDALDNYFSDEERQWMQCELEVIDPILLHGLSGDALRHHGVEAMKRLLNFYGKKQVINGVEFEPILDAKKCLDEYNDWKLFAVQETHRCIGLPTAYDRIMALYRIMDIKYGSHYMNLGTLQRLILLNWASSMSLERLFRARKLYQPATCSNYSYEGLSARLVLNHNSAEAGSVDSVILYMKAIRKWYELKQRRIYSAVSPLDDGRLL